MRRRKSLWKNAARANWRKFPSCISARRCARKVCRSRRRRSGAKIKFEKLVFVKSISKLVSDVRDLINAPRKQYVLLQDLANWKMLCSCLDAIGDTELAFVAFLKQR